MDSRKFFTKPSEQVAAPDCKPTPSIHLINRVLKGSSAAVRPGRIEVRAAEYDSGCSIDPDGRGEEEEEVLVLFLNEVGDNGGGSIVHRFEILSITSKTSVVLDVLSSTGLPG